MKSESSKKPAKRAHRSKKLGLAPGTLVYTGDVTNLVPVRLTVFLYDQHHLEELEIKNLAQLEPMAEEICNGERKTDTEPKTLWLNVDGVHNTDIINEIGRLFNLHPLVLEDIVNISQRAKRVDYDHYSFVCLRTIPSHKCLIGGAPTEQISFILGKHFVLTFQEERGDTFDHVRNRIRQAGARMRGQGADYLLYALIDSIVDYYFVALEELGEEVDRLEESLLSENTADLLVNIHRRRRELIVMRRAVWPVREIVSSLTRDEHPLIRSSIRVYLQDLYDHVIESIELVEMLRDLTSGLVELHLSSASNKVNAVMKTLTVIATIFMPLTFIVGIYGMNFDVMPELHWRYGYPASMILMGLIAAGMVAHFRRRGWL